MSFTVVIPARYASTRIPGKMLADVAGQPMIAHTVARANESSAQRVIVATDDQRIAAALASSDCEVCMTAADHQSGSDRLQEVVNTLSVSDEEIVVNVQGDEPLIPGKLIDQVASALGRDKQADMATAAKALDESELDNPHVVKVVFAHDGRALYFSRAPIPYAQNKRVSNAWHHIGIYAYRGAFLRNYDRLLPSTLEQTESLEQLRALDNGKTIIVETVDYDTGVGVDTEQDLDRVRALMAQRAD